jgi:DNA-binding NarL/FixJ family response regulator
VIAGHHGALDSPERRKAAVDVLIVDDHPLVHQTLGAAIRTVLPQVRVHDAYALEKALELAQALPSDSLVLLDLGLPDCSGIEVLRRFRRTFPVLRIAIVSASEGSALVTAALKAGAAGYIPKTSSPDMIVAALRLIVSGGTYIPPQALADLGKTPVFTARQLEVLQLIAQGSSNRDIARALGIADNTAKQHTHAVFQVLNVSSRSQAIVAAARMGIDLS